jgi:hypothetical protein
MVRHLRCSISMRVSGTTVRGRSARPADRSHPGGTRSGTSVGKASAARCAHASVSEKPRIHGVRDRAFRSAIARASGTAAAGEPGPALRLPPFNAAGRSDTATAAIVAAAVWARAFLARHHRQPGRFTQLALLSNRTATRLEHLEESLVHRLRLSVLGLSSDDVAKKVGGREHIGALPP